MIALYLIAAHLAGDFLLQTRWQAAGKFGWSDDANWLRTQHTLTYCLPFIVVMAVEDVSIPRSLGFLGALYVLHFLTDAQRFLSTPGDVLQWWIDRRRNPEVTAQAWVDHLYARPLDIDVADPKRLAWRLDKARGITGKTLRFPPPNPWPAMPLMINQSLCLLQLAVLGGLLLS